MSASLVGQTLLNQYRVETFIASGGMGIIYRVWDLKRSVPLAMKVLHADLADDPSIFKRFQREAIALKKLTHPNIVPFYGLFKSGDLAFLLERYIDGPSLKDLLKQRKGQPLSIPEALTLLKVLCAALGYAHVHGVVHCDVKPGNVMLDGAGNVYLADFGVARHAESSTTTLVGAGTPAYMAPEQIRGEAVSPATDVYALGVMLFDMLTGQRPFQGNEEGTESAGPTVGERIRYAHLHLEPPDPRSLNPALPRALAQMVLKALAKKPEERYRGTQEMFAAVCLTAGINPETLPDRLISFTEFEGFAGFGETWSPVPEDKKQGDKGPSRFFGIPRIAVLVGGIVLVVMALFGIVNVSGLIARSDQTASIPQITSGKDVESSKTYETTGNLTGSTDSPEFGGSGPKTNTPVPSTTPIPTMFSTSTPEPLAILQGKKIVYIYKDDLLLAQEFQSLLQTMIVPLEIIQLGDLKGANLSIFELVIIGPDTDRSPANGHAGVWVEQGLAGLAKSWNQPVLALGEGGMIFLESQELDIGFRNGVYMPQEVAQSYTSGGVIIVDKDHPIWNTPFQILETLPTIYNPPSGWVEIHIPTISNVSNITILGKAEGDNQYAPLIQQGKYLLWGFESGPNQMSDNGKKLFINLIGYLISQASSGSVNLTLSPGESDPIKGTPTIIPGAPWYVTFEHRFPPGFWPKGAHEYTFEISCTFWGETSYSTNSFEVSEDAQLLPDVVYLRINKVTDRPSEVASPSDKPIAAIHPSQPTVAELNIKFSSLSEAASAEEECDIEFGWDGQSSHILKALPPYQR